MLKVRRPTAAFVTEVIFPPVIELNKLQSVMRRQLTAISLALFAVLSFEVSSTAQSSIAQDEQYESSRKIVTRVNPQYPDVARSIQLRGTVKAEALVEPNGVVKNVEVKGGNPVLGRAAQNAIYKWKWAPAAHQTREPIEVKFAPQ
jgi:TonB family protein